VGGGEAPLLLDHKLEISASNSGRANRHPLQPPEFYYTSDMREDRYMKRYDVSHEFISHKTELNPPDILPDACPVRALLEAAHDQSNFSPTSNLRRNVCVYIPLHGH
jgi:hypothetical protein